MSTTDNYLFEQSMQSQGEDKFSPYADLQFNFLVDSNNSVYQTNNCMVEFNLSNIYSANKFVDTSLCYVAIPVSVVWALTTDSAVVAPSTLAMNALVSLKSNYVNLVNSCELVLDGKTINQSSNFHNIYTHIKMMSELTEGDLATMGTSLGFSSCIDNHRSMKYTATADTAAGTNNQGTGLCNNVVFSAGVPAAYSQALNVYSSDRNNNINANGSLSGKICNKALQERIFRFPNLTSTSDNGIYGTNGLISTINTGSDLRPYYVTQNNFGILYDVALIPLKYLLDSMKNVGLTQKLSGVLRLYLNTGYTAIQTGPTVATPSYSLNTLAYNSFSNVIPISINYLGDNVALPATVKNIVAGVFVGKPPSVSVLGANFDSAGASHKLPNCRFYYPQIELMSEPQSKYIEVNQHKKVVHRQYTVNNYIGITSGQTEIRLVQSGIKNPLNVIIVPYLATDISATANTSGFVSQLINPFDTFGATFSPIILGNLQVQVGGKNILGPLLNYGYDVFLQQISSHESLGLSDLGVNQGLFNQEFWELNRVYVIDVARSQSTDKMTPRSIQVSFTNNCSKTINYLVFCEYLDSFEVNTLVGTVNMTNQL